MVLEALPPGEAVSSEIPSPPVAAPRASPHQPWVEVEWVTPFSPARWEELSRLGKEAASLEGSEVPVEEGSVLLGPVLGDEADPRAGLVKVRRHSEDRLAWSLRVGTLAGPELPESARRVHEHLKGRRGLVETILRAAAGGAIPIANHEIRFLLDPEHWRCHLLPRPASQGSPDARVLDICAGATMEYVGYRLHNGVCGIREFSIICMDHGDAQVYDVLVIATSPLKLAPGRWLPLVDDACELVVSRFFEHEEGARV